MATNPDNMHITKSEVEAHLPVAMTKTMMNQLAKLLPLADALEKVEVLEDGSLYLKTKKHLIIDSEGHQVFHSKEGQIVIKGTTTHLQPTTQITDNLKNPDVVVETLNAENDKALRLLRDRNLG